MATGFFIQGSHGNASAIEGDIHFGITYHILVEIGREVWKYKVRSTCSKMMDIRGQSVKEQVGLS